MRTFGILFFTSLIIFLADGAGLLDRPKGLVQTVTVPVQYALFAAGQAAGDAFSFLTFWRSGENRIKNLELRNAELAAAKNEAGALKTENNELRKQLGAKATIDRRVVPATVLGAGRYLEVAAGESDFVRVGQTVVYLDNFIGKVIRVSPRASFIILPTDPQAKVPVKINKARGLTIGQFNSSILVDRIAQTEDFNQGDPVLTSGEGESAPADLVVGRIGRIESQETDLFKRATVQPAVSYSDLTMVFIILD